MIFQGCINVFSHLPWPVNDTGISLLPDRYQAATWTNADLVPIGPFEQSQATCTFPSNKSKVFSTCMWHCLLPFPLRCELLRIHWPLLLHSSRYNSPIVHVSGNYDEQFVYKNSPWLNTLVLGDGPIPYACQSPYLNQCWFIVTQAESNRTHFFINDIYVEKMS